ncbi:hypothetical protein M2432_005021 [Mycobacterium sp. OTB74]|jgi:hypothetical protein|nr:hypothetical protein [Mycobacterium sp. OTB74]
MALRITSFIEFVRAGYASGAPTTGYIPLLGLVPRRLCDDDIDTIVGGFQRQQRQLVGASEIGIAISAVTGRLPSEQDIDRVCDRLSMSGLVVRLRG